MINKSCAEKEKEKKAKQNRLRYVDRVWRLLHRFSKQIEKAHLTGFKDEDGFEFESDEHILLIEKFLNKHVRDFYLESCSVRVLERTLEGIKEKVKEDQK